MRRLSPIRKIPKRALLWLAVLLLSQIATAAVVRGRLDRTLPNGARVPVSGIAVTVSSRVYGRSSPTVSDQGGMFYLNVRAGSYNLEVWIRGTNRQPIVYQIRVNEPYTDIPPLNLP